LGDQAGWQTSYGFQVNVKCAVGIGGGWNWLSVMSRVGICSYWRRINYYQRVFLILCLCDGVRLRLWTATTNGPIVHPPSDIRDTDRGNSEKYLSQCHFVHHKSHTDWPGREPGPPQWKTGD
jgi:hypothetical protein